MDSIVNYLPAPKEIKHCFLDHYSPTDICAMAFKIVHHPQKGILTFIRVYSGTLKEGDSVFNVNLGRSEKITRLYIAFADDFRYVELVVCVQFFISLLSTWARHLIHGEDLNTMRAEPAGVIANSGLDDNQERTSKGFFP